MPDMQISQSDIESLGQKLGRLEPELSENERALLSFVLSVASAAISHSGAEGSVVSRESDQETPVVVRIEGHLPSIRDQFTNAFIPGALSDIVAIASIGPWRPIGPGRPPASAE